IQFALYNSQDEPHTIGTLDQSPLQRVQFELLASSVIRQTSIEKLATNVQSRFILVNLAFCIVQDHIVCIQCLDGLAQLQKFVHTDLVHVSCLLSSQLDIELHRVDSMVFREPANLLLVL